MVTMDFNFDSIVLEVPYSLLEVAAPPIQNHNHHFGLIISTQNVMIRPETIMIIKSRVVIENIIVRDVKFADYLYIGIYYIFYDLILYYIPLYTNKI